VAYSIAPNEALGLGTNTLDGALIIMSYHDLYYADPSGGWPAIDASQFLDQLCTALKPGARLLIVDHQARAGSGKEDTQALHRIEDTFAIADFRSHCFELERSSELLRNADDDHSKNVFDPAIRGKTDRFVHVYRKSP
jgi:predicted methyltransferase